MTWTNVYGAEMLSANTQSKYTEFITRDHSSIQITE